MNRKMNELADFIRDPKIPYNVQEKAKLMDKEIGGLEVQNWGERKRARENCKRHIL